MTGDPSAEYAAALEARRFQEAAARRRGRRIANARLLVFAAGMVVLWLVVTEPSVSGVWLGLVAVGFIMLVSIHDGVLRGAEHARRAAEFHAAGIARLEGRWADAPQKGPPAGRPDHPYADDLDCLGSGSLFHRISTARTGAGREQLASWLLEAADPATIRARQRAVQELRTRLILREEVALRGEDAQQGVDSSRLVAWAEGSGVLPQGPVRFVAGLLSGLTIALIVAGFLGAGPLPALFALACQTGLAWRLRSRVRSVIGEVDTPAHELALLTELLALLERETFEAPLLVDLQSVWRAEGREASKRVASLRLLMDLLDARRNQFFAPIAGLLLWSTQVALAIEAWRRENGHRLHPWLDALGTMEALDSLASFSYERPTDVFPEILDLPEVRLEAEGLGHPLLSPESCVRNDLALGGDERLLVVSGSNMSGKSTLLRAIGTNVALAQAGSSVCARRFALSPVRLGASVQLRDSLLGGQSRFYAEIQRLQTIFVLAEEEDAPPVLFLLDEILHGTNAQERRIGADQVVKALLARGAAGLVTTHDLALAGLLSPPGRNVHFADHIEAGALHFDYQLRPGVATLGNALALMREVGLPIEASGPEETALDPEG
jgi:hypothetical protein